MMLVLANTGWSLLFSALYGEVKVIISTNPMPTICYTKNFIYKVLGYTSYENIGPSQQARDADPMLRLRRCANISPALGQRLVFAGMLISTPSDGN